MTNELWDTRYLVSRNAFLLTSWIAFSTATICFIGRIATRLRIFGHLSLDDIFVFLAWISSLIWAITWQVESSSVYLLHNMQTYKMPLDFTSYLEHEYNDIIVVVISICCQIIGLWCVKYGFLAFFWKLGPKDGIRVQKYLWWIAAVYVTVALIVNLSVPPWSCLVITHDLTAIIKRCSTRKVAKWSMTSIRVQTVFDVTSDIAILVLPFSLLWQVRIPLRRKFTLAGVFSLTFFICLCAILRMIIVDKTAVGGFVDVTWLFIWSKIELDAAIIIVSLASFRALFTDGRSNLHYQNEIGELSLQTINQSTTQVDEITTVTRNRAKEERQRSDSTQSIHVPVGIA